MFYLCRQGAESVHTEPLVPHHSLAAYYRGPDPITGTAAAAARLMRNGVLLPDLSSALPQAVDDSKPS